MEKALTEKQYYIRKRTERPFQNEFNDNIKRVIILCSPSCLCLILKQNSIQERMA
jgi:peptide methionine sulfoxide reductase MsrB